MRNKGKVVLLSLLLLFLPLSRLVVAQTPQAKTTSLESKTAATAVAQTPPVIVPREQSTDPKVEKIKQQITKRVSSKKSRVKIKLHTGQELKGRIDVAGAEQFTITEDKSGRKTEIAYVDVSKVSGRGMSTSTKLLIVFGAVVAVVAILAIIAVKTFDPFENGIL
jgi:hypothetical protein